MPDGKKLASAAVTVGAATVVPFHLDGPVAVSTEVVTDSVIALAVTVQVGRYITGDHPCSVCSAILAARVSPEGLS